mmetsp:Transcript_1443/g.4291  ORF Transcript_1443/g.4291 Transcript_1443/m.4291 type:complete len:378 (+) Transcript_1443:331-1464(+)
MFPGYLHRLRGAHWVLGRVHSCSEGATLGRGGQRHRAFVILLGLCTLTGARRVGSSAMGGTHNSGAVLYTVVHSVAHDTRKLTTQCPCGSGAGAGWGVTRASDPLHPHRAGIVHTAQGAGDGGVADDVRHVHGQRRSHPVAAGGGHPPRGSRHHPPQRMPGPGLAAAVDVGQPPAARHQLGDACSSGCGRSTLQPAAEDPWGGDSVGAHDAAPRGVGHRGEQLHVPLRFLRGHELAAHVLRLGAARGAGIRGQRQDAAVPGHVRHVQRGWLRGRLAHRPPLLRGTRPQDGQHCRVLGGSRVAGPHAHGQRRAAGRPGDVPHPGLLRLRPRRLLGEPHGHRPQVRGRGHGRLQYRRHPRRSDWGGAVRATVGPGGGCS